MMYEIVYMYQYQLGLHVNESQHSSLSYMFFFV